MTGYKSEEFLPTYKGFIYTTKDALIIIDQVLKNNMNYVTKRPTEKDKHKYIKSGSVFVFIEQYSQIKRWTDGISWSASRMLGKFLIYKENKHHELGDAVRRRKSNDDLEEKLPITAYELSGGDMLNSVYENGGGTKLKCGEHFMKCSLDTSLIKKSFSITVKEGKWSGNTIHLVSYYSYEDVFHRRLPIPSTDSKVADKRVSLELLKATNSFSYKRSRNDYDDGEFMTLLRNLKEDGFDEDEVTRYYTVSEGSEYDGQNDRSDQQAEYFSLKPENNRKNVSPPPYWEIDPPLSRFSPSFHNSSSFSSDYEFDFINNLSIYEPGLPANYNTYHNSEIYEPRCSADSISAQTFKYLEPQVKDTKHFELCTNYKPHHYNTDTFMATPYAEKRAHVVYTHYPIAAILESKYNDSLLENASLSSDDSYPY